MITFNVVKEPCGWAVRMGERMTTPFWSRELAICEANTLAEAIRGHGQRAEVVVEGVEPDIAKKRPTEPRTFPSDRARRRPWLERE